MKSHEIKKLVQKPPRKTAPFSTVDQRLPGKRSSTEFSYHRESQTNCEFPNKSRLCFFFFFFVCPTSTTVAIAVFGIHSSAENVRPSEFSPSDDALTLWRRRLHRQHRQQQRRQHQHAAHDNTKIRYAPVMNGSSTVRAQHRTMSKFLKLAHKFNSFYLNGKPLRFSHILSSPTGDRTSLNVVVRRLCVFRLAEEGMSRVHCGRRSSRFG